MDLLSGNPTHRMDSANRYRRRKWAGLRFLHSVINQPAYRYHSITCALEATPGMAYTVGRDAFVQRLMAEYKFDRTLRMDTKLCALYECFEGAEDDAIDYRDVLCCMMLLRHYRKIREEPRMLFQNLILVFSNEAGTRVLRQNALRVARMGALHGDEILQTSSRLDRYLVEEAGSRGLKPKFRVLDVIFLMEVIESHPSILVAFRTQLWQRVPKSWRMGDLRAVQAMGASSIALTTMKLQRAACWYATKLSRWVIVGWKTFKNQSKLTKAHRVAVGRVTRRRAIRIWHFRVSQEARRRRVVTPKRRRIAILRRYFKRVVHFAKTKKKLSAITSAFSKRGKLVICGMGLLCGVLKKHLLRLSLRTWYQTASLMAAWEFAVKFSQACLRRRTFFCLRNTVRTLVTARRLEDEAEARAARVAEAVEEAEKKKKLLAEGAKFEAKRRKAEAKATLMRKRAAEHRARIEEARARSAARDAGKLARQREVRRRRVYEECARVTRSFDAEWVTKVNDIVELEMEVTRNWLLIDKEACFRVQKELEILKRKFFAGPTPETANLERSLRDPANIIFAKMANLLYNENKSLHAFFNHFDKEGDGYLDHEEFKEMVFSLGINLSGEQVRAVIRAIDVDGSGYIDFEEFKAAVKRHEEVCGVAGSPWKMYISPVHAIMILHNVDTNEEIWDYKATDNDLKRVVTDNIVAIDGITAKKKALEEREEAWARLLRDRAAMTLQRHYHVWTARKKRALLCWKRDLEKAKGRGISESKACTRIQSWWRKLLAKWLALRLLQITVEVLFDPGFNQQYYFNHGLGWASWEVPKMLTRWHGDDARMPELPEWVLISRIFGQPYYFNTRSGLRQDRTPLGYMRCFSCVTQLATRRCKTEGRELCFLCYRHEHLEGDNCWHEWELSKAHTCGMCSQRAATLVCSGCRDSSSKFDNTSTSAEGKGVGWLTLCDGC